MRVSARTPLIGIVVLSLGLAAPAAEAQSGGTPRPESIALRRFHPDYTWEGTIKAGVLWAGSPEVRTRGRATFRWIHDGNLVVGDFEQDHFDGSTKVSSWRAHYLAGWDPAARQYRAVLIDDNSWGAAAQVTLDGQRFVMVSPPYPTDGGTAATRTTLRITGPDTFAWTKEVSENGGAWRITEEAHARAARPESRK